MCVHICTCVYGSAVVVHLSITCCVSSSRLMCMVAPSTETQRDIYTPFAFLLCLYRYPIYLPCLRSLYEQVYCRSVCVYNM